MFAKMLEIQSTTVWLLASEQASLDFENKCVVYALTGAAEVYLGATRHLERRLGEHVLNLRRAHAGERSLLPSMPVLQRALARGDTLGVLALETPPAEQLHDAERAWQLCAAHHDVPIVFGGSGVPKVRPPAWPADPERLQSLVNRAQALSWPDAAARAAIALGSNRPRPFAGWMSLILRNAG